MYVLPSLMENTLLPWAFIPLCSHPSVPCSKLGFVMYEVQSVCASVVTFIWANSLFAI